MISYCTFYRQLKNQYSYCQYWCADNMYTVIKVDLSIKIWQYSCKHITNTNTNIDEIQYYYQPTVTLPDSWVLHFLTLVNYSNIGSKHVQHKALGIVLVRQIAFVSRECRLEREDEGQYGYVWFAALDHSQARWWRFGRALASAFSAAHRSGQPRAAACHLRVLPPTVRCWWCAQQTIAFECFLGLLMIATATDTQRKLAIIRAPPSIRRRKDRRRVYNSTFSRPPCSSGWTGFGLRSGRVGPHV